MGKDTRDGGGIKKPETWRAMSGTLKSVMIVEYRTGVCDRATQSGGEGGVQNKVMADGHDEVVMI